jgi:hypothetical protein
LSVFEQPANSLGSGHSRLLDQQASVQCCDAVLEFSMSLDAAERWDSRGRSAVASDRGLRTGTLFAIRPPGQLLSINRATGSSDRVASCRLYAWLNRPELVA